LSATPYKFNKEALETVWEAESGSVESNKVNEIENPFEDWGALCKIMQMLGANISDTKMSFVERTQRNFFWREEESFWKTQNQIVDKETYKKHIKYLSYHFRQLKDDTKEEVIKHDENIKWVQCAPEYWRFSYGYKIHQENREEIYSSDCITKNVKDHMFAYQIIQGTQPHLTC
jgi:hypothetical protein